MHLDPPLHLFISCLLNHSLPFILLTISFKFSPSHTLLPSLPLPPSLLNNHLLFILLSLTLSFLMSLSSFHSFTFVTFPILLVSISPSLLLLLLSFSCFPYFLISLFPSDSPSSNNFPNFLFLLLLLLSSSLFTTSDSPPESVPPPLFCQPRPLSGTSDRSYRGTLESRHPSSTRTVDQE